jgi:chorismate mutase
MIETCAHCIRDIIQQTDLELTDLLDKRVHIQGRFLPLKLLAGITLARKIK